MIVLLDNGHGNNTPGKRSPIWPDGAQLFEYEFNRDIVIRIIAGLKKLNIKYELIVPESYDISLPKRVERVNLIAKSQKCFLVSVHGNAGGGTGWEVFTSIGETESDGIATIFYSEALRAIGNQFKMRKDTIDGDVDKEENFYILKHTTCPAILTENLFMDNYNDCKFMMSDSGRNIIANFHIEAIKKLVP